MTRNKYKILLILALTFQVLIVRSQKHIDTDCCTPYHIPIDSLYRYIVSRSDTKILKSDYVQKRISLTKEQLENLNYVVNADSLMNILQDSIISKIGFELFCENISMKYDCFKFPIKCENSGVVLRMTFDFKLPKIKEDVTSTSVLDYTLPIQCAFYRKTPNGPIEVGISRFPQCINGDCGFKITKNQAISLAKSSGFIKEGENYFITIEPYEWKLQKGDKYINIDLITGNVSKVQTIIKI